MAGRRKNGGIFITFEGGDGSGKSTQLRLLAEWLERYTDWKVTTTREPGGTIGGDALRDLLVKGEIDWDDTTEALLMTAARREHVLKLIEPALDQGHAVLSDRFYDSTIAYQQAAGGADPALIRLLNDRFLGGIKPDITILLDVGPSLGNLMSLTRSERPGNTETRFESKGLEYHKRVREGFMKLAKKEKRFIVIKSFYDENRVHKEIITALAPRLEEYK